MATTVSVPYEDYNLLLKAKADLETIKQVVKTPYPDETCMLITIKSLLGIEITTPPTTSDPSNTGNGGSGSTSGSGDPAGTTP